MEKENMYLKNNNIIKWNKKLKKKNELINLVLEPFTYATLVLKRRSWVN